MQHELWWKYGGMGSSLGEGQDAPSLMRWVGAGVRRVDGHQQHSIMLDMLDR
jgi:hypothetical protein